MINAALVATLWNVARRQAAEPLGARGPGENERAPTAARRLNFRAPGSRWGDPLSSSGFILNEDMTSPTSFRDAIAAYIQREARPADKFGHQPRMYALTRVIGEGLDYDDDVVYAAVWLHDLGVFLGHRPADLAELVRWDSVSYALDRTPGILSGFGFPAHKIAAVVEAIRTHQPASEPGTTEGIIVRDADILEQLGAVGILRAVSKVGRDTRFLDFASAVEGLHRNCTTLPGQLHLARARALSVDKVRILEAFLEAATAEGQPALF